MVLFFFSSRRRHTRCGRDWSSDVCSSDLVLAERFVELVGMPPMQYLARWRMQLAADQLSRSKSSIGEIANRLGYGSEAALSRAFKRIVGVSPTHWRQGRRREGPALTMVAPSPEPTEG